MVTLTIGSVMGRDFAAQVIAQVQDVPEREAWSNNSRASWISGITWYRKPARYASASNSSHGIALRTLCSSSSSTMT